MDDIADPGRGDEAAEARLVAALRADGFVRVEAEAMHALLGAAATSWRAFAGTWDDDGHLMTDAIAEAVRRPVKTWRMPWALLPLVGLFNPTMKEMVEMRPFWENPVRLDNADLVAAIGEEPHTALDIAMATSLSALGCR